MIEQFYAVKIEPENRNGSVARAVLVTLEHFGGLHQLAWCHISAAILQKSKVFFLARCMGIMLLLLLRWSRNFRKHDPH